MRVIVACECSATVRDAFLARGHDAWSCDLLPSEKPGPHIIGDILRLLKYGRATPDGQWFGDEWDLMICHPPCTYLSVSSVWALKDPDFVRYPGVGYHQRVKLLTLTGAARRSARDDAVLFAVQLMQSAVPKVCMENPVGLLSTLYREPDQIIQPYEFGDDASKKTCLWLKGLPKLVIDPAMRFPGRPS